jgi:hypothetical protein
MATIPPTDDSLSEIQLRYNFSYSCHNPPLSHFIHICKNHFFQHTSCLIRGDIRDSEREKQLKCMVLVTFIHDRFRGELSISQLDCATHLIFLEQTVPIDFKRLLFLSSGDSDDNLYHE